MSALRWLDKQKSSYVHHDRQLYDEKIDFYRREKITRFANSLVTELVHTLTEGSYVSEVGV